MTIKNILQKTFSITNIESHKQITILGLKIKFQTTKSLGRVGHIICTVAEVLAAIAFVMILITTILLGTIGKKGDIIKYQVSTKVNASIDLKGFVDKPSAEEAARIRESLSDGTLTVNGQAKNADVDFTDDGEITLKADGNSYSITQKAIVK